MFEWIQALQALRRHHLRPEKEDFASRQQRLLALIESLSDSTALLRAKDPASDLFSETFYVNELWKARLENLKIKVAQPPQASSSPLGVVYLEARTSLAGIVLIENLIESLWAGNVVLVGAFDHQKDFLQEVVTQAIRAGWSDLDIKFQILPDSEASRGELRQLILAHPSLQAFRLMNPVEKLDLPKAAVQKRYQVFRGGKSTAFIFSKVHVESAAHHLFHALCEGWGTHSWSPSRILILEDLEKSFLETWRALAISAPRPPPSISEQTNQIFQKLAAQGARAVQPELGWGLLENVSNCDEAHQSELVAPWCFLMTIKYPHEMAKWMQNLSGPVALGLWGPADRSLKLAQKIEVANVSLGSLWGSQTDLFHGVKESLVGGSSSRNFGDFYLVRRDFDGWPPNP